jgi:hypothetical protein
VIEADEIIVDRFGHMDRAEFVPLLARLACDNANRVGRIIAADVEEIADVMRLEDFENLLAIFEVRLVPGRAQRPCATRIFCDMRRSTLSSRRAISSNEPT